MCSYFPFTVINELRRDAEMETKATFCGQSKSKVCSYFPFTDRYELRRDAVVETKATLTVVRARVKCVHILRLPS